jgi:hypothetical protein
VVYDTDDDDDDDDENDEDSDSENDGVILKYKGTKIKSYRATA